MRRCLASAIAIAILAPALAAAQPRPISPVAKRELERGLALFEAHDYAGAIGAFDAGYAIDPHPDFLYAKAQAQRIGGDCRGALASYDAFLASKPPEKEATRARTNIERCTELLAASAPSAEPVTPSPPPVTPRPEPQEPSRPVITMSSRAWWKDRPGLMLAGTGVAALVTGATFAWIARSNAADAADAGNLDDWYTLQSAHDRNRTVAGVAAGLGGALLVTAAIRFALAPRSAGDHAVTATASASPDGAALVLGRLVVRLAALVAFAALAGCGSVPPYHCDVDADCAGGVCASAGACAFADPGCATGFSYDASAGELAGTCTAGAVTGDTADQPRKLEELQTIDVAGARDDYTPSCATSGHGRDVFFQVTITELSRLYLDTYGSNFGAVLAIRPGTCAAAKPELACGTASCSARLHQWSDVVEPGTYCVIADRADDREAGTTLVLRSFVGDPAPLGRLGFNSGNTCADDLWDGTCSLTGAPDTTWFVMSCTATTLATSTCSTDPSFDGVLQAYTLDETERSCTGGCDGNQIRLNEPGAAWIVAEAFDEFECGPITVEISAF